MKCSNCGKDTPFTGNVCHWCGANKMVDQQDQVYGMSHGIAGAGVGLLIGALASGFMLAVVLAFAGGFIGAGVGVFRSPHKR
jgi:hypothetical protein